MNNPYRSIPRIGMGCWAIGGAFSAGETPLGWAGADDDESRRAIEAIWDAGVRLFDTAAAYGAGHSERLLGEVIGNRDGAIIVTKFAPLIDERRREILGEDISPAAIRASALASRERLRRDRIELLLCHKNSMTLDDAGPVFDTLESLVDEGVIAAFGWSTDFHDRLDRVARPGMTAVEHAMNLFFDAPSMAKVAERHGLAQLIRGPLAMGLLTGKFQAGDQIGSGDIRSNTMDWMDYFKGGVPSADLLNRLDSVRDLLTTGGRSVGQGALCWLLARSTRLFPIPGAKTEAQAVENATAMDFGPLPTSVMSEIETLIDRPPEGAPRER